MKCRFIQKSLLALSILPFPLTGVYATADGYDIAFLSNEEKFVIDSVKRSLQGNVVDASDNTPLIGATIKVKGTQYGGVTDVDGNFSISIPNSYCTLEISYIGYKTQEIYITDQGIVNIRLMPDNEVLSEVIIVGAGTQKKCQ